MFIKRSEDDVRDFEKRIHVIIYNRTPLQRKETHTHTHTRTRDAKKTHTK